MVATGTEVSTSDMSVFVAPEEARVVIVDSPWMDLSIPIGVSVERITIPIISDPATRAEAERVYGKLVALKPHVEADEDAHFELGAIISDILDDMEWYDGELAPE